MKQIAITFNVFQCFLELLLKFNLNQTSYTKLSLRFLPLQFFTRLLQFLTLHHLIFGIQFLHAIIFLPGMACNYVFRLLIEVNHFMQDCQLLV